MKIILYIIFSVLVIIAWFAGLFYHFISSSSYVYPDSNVTKSTVDLKEIINEEKVIEKENSLPMSGIKEDLAKEEKIIIKESNEDNINQVFDNGTGIIKLENVPFYVQAPFVNWDDPVYQNACEETSVLMAIDWINEKKRDLQDLNDTIKEISVWEDYYFGTSFDTSVMDTFLIFKEYFKYTNLKIKQDFSVSDMVLELEKGHLLIAPANGQVLKNKYYTPPGPDNHMIAIIGYDETKKQFITHDPGTRHGANYHYDENILLEAIQDYPTGDHIVRKDKSRLVIVVEPISQE